MTRHEHIYVEKNVSQVNYWFGVGSSVVGVAGVVLEAPGSRPRAEIADVL